MRHGDRAGTLAAGGATASDRAFVAASALVFVACATATIWWCGSMDGDMPMPGGWTMSMAWMRMPGQTWSDAAVTFLGMWILMMIAMMTPSLVPMLARYRDAVVDGAAPSLGALTAVGAAGYFTTWTLIGVCLYPVGVALAAAATRWPAVDRAVPLATGLVVLVAGCVQLSGWKRRQLARCRAHACDRPLPRHFRVAWRHGLGLGVDCARCCSAAMAILLVAGVMDVGVMALVATAITAERTVQRPERAARAAGFVAIAFGVVAIVRSIVSG
jgi:predicted metal-binding membrane protein